MVKLYMNIEIFKDKAYITGESCIDEMNNIQKMGGGILLFLTSNEISPIIMNKS